MLYVVGIGPGNPDYVVPRGLQLIKEAPVLVGSERALADFAQPHQITYAIKGSLSDLVHWIKEQLGEHDVVVLVSGDTGYYSLLPYLKKTLPDQPMEVIPGISAMIFAFARIQEVWQDADLLSFHGRVPPEEALRYEPHRKLGFLTDKVHNGAAIAQILHDHGWPSDCRIVGCERLSYEDEHIEELTIQSMSQTTGFEHAVIIAFAHKN
ncbi:precorrin-6y C5,15-methyltransferase (decarboxylating) subunit CbiE [uncultured Veillonella sp.]|uniref:precorrin-6y C5,15-methyltransferase (decarboxylating) subunit CbiE n=1 Tax=uncultured Veillonella sp. TaxID=159268 RepID=UPI0025DDD6AE|nr:precorrin-6y C5,15-methyltransferase (decarboxylating) subunit CbiE [uncultured Veillonella sp.]